MENLLFIDTETSGKYDFRLQPDDERQPHIVQLAALLCDPRGREVASLNTLIRPEGWTIEPEAQKVHGISLEECEGLGMRIGGAMQLLRFFADKCGVLVAHNVEFDGSMLDRELHAMHDVFHPAPFGSHMRWECTMELGTPLCKLPGKAGKFKWPKLTELHHHLFSEGFEGEHGAMADVQACKRCYFAMRK